MDYAPILISIKTASAAIFFTFFLGLAAAWAVAELPWRRVRAAVDGLLLLPLVLPPTVAGFFLLLLFGARGPAGRFFLEYFGVKIAFSWSATVLAAVVISFPLMYRSARGALEQVDDNLVHAARTLGMSEWTLFWRVRIPAALPGIVSGAILAFARGLGEFGATAMLAGNIAGKTRTLPLAVYSAVAAGDMENAYAYVLIITALSFGVVVAMNRVAGSGAGKRVERRRLWR